MYRSDVDWMMKADDVILEFLENHPGKPIIATPAVVEVNTTYSASTIRSRIRELESHGLVEYFDEGRSMYQITDLGKRYLDGDVSADALEDSD